MVIERETDRQPINQPNQQIKQNNKNKYYKSLI